MGVKLCKLCNERPATVPDRDSRSVRKEVCGQCHAGRLMGDLEAVLGANRRCPKCESPMIHSRLAGYHCPRGCHP